jgi:hypothetical protein
MGWVLILYFSGEKEKRMRHTEESQEDSEYKVANTVKC